MYLTKLPASIAGADFDWDHYFVSRGASPGDEQEEGSEADREAFLATRRHFREDRQLFGFVFHRFMREMLVSASIGKGCRVLELGAATGFLSGWLCRQFGGPATLVDRSEEAYRSFLAFGRAAGCDMEYLRTDIFQLNLPAQFGIVCSFGVIEHFPDKREILAAHSRFCGEGGYVLVMIPMDSPLTRAFYEINYELNKGYRELLTEKELRTALEHAGLRIVQTARSRGYVYDFAGALCTVEKNQQA